MNSEHPQQSEFSEQPPFPRLLAFVAAGALVGWLAAVYFDFDTVIARSLALVPKGDLGPFLGVAWILAGIAVSIYRFKYRYGRVPAIPLRDNDDLWNRQNHSIALAAWPGLVIGPAILWSQWDRDYVLLYAGFAVILSAIGFYMVIMMDGFSYDFSRISPHLVDKQFLARNTFVIKTIGIVLSIFGMIGLIHMLFVVYA